MLKGASGLAFDLHIELHPLHIFNVVNAALTAFFLAD